MTKKPINAIAQAVCQIAIISVRTDSASIAPCIVDNCAHIDGALSVSVS